VFISNFLFAEVEYDIQDIGTLQTHSSQAIAINNQEQILGWYNIDGSNNGKHYFVRNKNGEFREIPNKTLDAGLTIEWLYMTDNGKAYGIFAVNQATTAICMWDQTNGFVKLGVIPGKEVVAINKLGQVLIKSVVENENGKTIRRPVIWENGKITKLKGLEGDIGIESEESYGFDMNDKGEVVGQCNVYFNYKNNIYKQIHAVKWINGKAIDLHNTVPKAPRTTAIAINNNQDILIDRESSSSDSMKYIVKKDKSGIPTSQVLNKIKNAGAYNSAILINGGTLLYIDTLNNNMPADCIWMKICKIIDVNDDGYIIAHGETIYGEQHAMLLSPIKSN
jgi:uncharacterized membrane protein